MASPKVKLEGKKIAEKVMEFMDEYSFDPIYNEIEKNGDDTYISEILRCFPTRRIINDLDERGELHKGERCDKPYIKNSTRQFIADLMSNMIYVLNPFINKETMIEIKESCNAEYLINETEFYITSTFTTPLQKEYDKQRKVLSIGFGNKKIIMVDEEDFHVFLKALYYLYKCNEWIKKDDEKNKEQSKEPVFKKGNRIMYTIEDENGNTHAVTRLSERVYESKEHHTLFITDEEGTVTGIYKEK